MSVEPTSESLERSRARASDPSAHPCVFGACTVLLPVVTETDALRQTIETIERTAGADVLEYLLLVCERTTPESLAVCAHHVARDPVRFRLHPQHLPKLGGALREGFAHARGSHVLLMASDLETDPEVVPTLLAQARREPSAIVTASRWLEGGGFRGYGALKTPGNRIFQALFARLYGTRLTDLTFGFRVFPTRLVQSIAWEELGHPFLFETLLKPLRLGIPVREVPARWTPRPEGTSQGARFRSLGYLRVGLRVRFGATPRLRP